MRGRTLREQAANANQRGRQRRKPDQRSQHTRERLGTAFLALVLEKPIEDVTVQNVLYRASVGRSTFYLHYRDKEDLLLSQLEHFLQTMSTTLSIRKEESHRVVPVAELFAHIGNQNRLYRTLADSGHLKDFFDLAEGYFARGIEQRLREVRRLPNLSQRELVLALPRWPGACYRSCDGGSIAARKNHHAPWTSYFTGWFGTDFKSNGGIADHPESASFRMFESSRVRGCPGPPV